MPLSAAFDVGRGHRFGCRFPEEASVTAQSMPATAQTRSGARPAGGESSVCQGRGQPGERRSRQHVPRRSRLERSRHGSRPARTFRGDRHRGPAGIGKQVSVGGGRAEARPAVPPMRIVGVTRRRRRSLTRRQAGFGPMRMATDDSAAADRPVLAATLSAHVSAALPVHGSAWLGARVRAVVGIALARG